MASIDDRAQHAQSRLRRTIDAIDERLGIRALEYPVPEHANNLSWSLGGVTACAFLVLLGTGILLVQFYAPVPESANASVRDMVTNVWGMRFIRALHFWAAQAMYVTGALHLLRVFFTGSYKKPREGNWLIGVAMFGLVIFAVFTGTVLKWDQEGFEALGHNIEIANLLGGVGIWFSPDFAGRISILVRLYGAHVVIIRYASPVRTSAAGMAASSRRSTVALPGSMIDKRRSRGILPPLFTITFTWTRSTSPTGNGSVPARMSRPSVLAPSGPWAASYSKSTHSDHRLSSWVRAKTTMSPNFSAGSRPQVTPTVA